MEKKRTIRIDQLLVEKGFAPSKERAKSYLMLGNILVNEQKIKKPGTKVSVDVDITIEQKDHPFVSRGGLKLEHALNQFQISVNNLIAMDIGASTGGFTDCLLQKSVAFVFSIDVGSHQLAPSLIQNKHIKNLEKTNFRYLTMESIGTFVDLIVIDTSFISLKLLLQKAKTFLTKKGHLIALIKPQFEVGKESIQKGGVIKKKSVHHETTQAIQCFLQQIGFQVLGLCKSPILGKKKGNQEFLIHCMKS